MVIGNIHDKKTIIHYEKENGKNSEKKNVAWK